MGFYPDKTLMLERISAIVERISTELRQTNDVGLDSEDDEWVSDELEAILCSSSALLIALEKIKHSREKRSGPGGVHTLFYPDKTRTAKREKFTIRRGLA